MFDYCEPGINRLNDIDVNESCQIKYILLDIFKILVKNILTIKQMFI